MSNTRCCHENESHEMTLQMSHTKTIAQIICSIESHDSKDHGPCEFMEM